MIAAMDMIEAQAWGYIGIALLTLLTGIAGLVVSTYNSLRLGRTEKKVDAQAGEIGVIRVATDGHNDALKKVLQIEKDRGEQLKEALRAAGIEIPVETKQTAPIPDPAPIHVEEPEHPPRPPEPPGAPIAA